MQQPPQIFQRIRHALQKVDLALVKAAKAVRAQCLHDADVDIGVIVLHEFIAAGIVEGGKFVEIVVEQLLPQFRRQIGLGVVEQGSDIVLQRAFAAALIVEKERMSVAQHDISRLEIAIHEVVAIRAQQEFRETAEIVFQRLFVEGDACEPEKVVLEIIQIPRDGLAIETTPRIAHLVVEVARGLDLKTRQSCYDFAVGVDCLR